MPPLLTRSGSARARTTAHNLARASTAARPKTNPAIPRPHIPFLDSSIRILDSVVPLCGPAHLRRQTHIGSLDHAVARAIRPVCVAPLVSFRILPHELASAVV